MGWEIMMGNWHNHRCHDKTSGLKNTKWGCWSLDKIGDRKRGEKKIEKSDSVMQFHPRAGGRGGRGGWEILHNSSSKNVDQNTCWFKNNDVEENKEMTYKSHFRWVFFFFFFFTHFWVVTNEPLKGPRSHCYLVWQVFWKCFREKCLPSQGCSIDVLQKTMASMNILSPSEKESGVKNSISTSQHLPESREEGEAGYMKKNEGKCFTF